MAQRESEREGGSKRRGKSRRDPRGTRLWTYAAGLFAVLLILVAALPTIVCSTPLLDFAMQRAVASSEWKIKASKLQVGWFTSFEASELELQGPSGATQIKIASVSSELKLLDLLRGASDYGTIQLQGLQLQTGLLPGMTSLEADLAKFNSSSSGDGTESSTSSGHYAIRLQLQNGDVSIVDPQGQIWKCGDINGSVLYESFGVEQKAVGQLAIVLQDPSQQSGKADLQFALDPTTAQQPAMWNGHLSADSLPLSFLQLAAVRVPALAEQLPRDLRGLTTGELRAAGTLAGDTIQLNANPLTIANLSANDARYSAKPWFVQQARVEGVMQWWQGNLSGNPLRITTDFTTTELNGIVAFDRLFGSMQNQLTALAGDLDVRVDVAKFNQALPGLLPLREEAQLTAGTARLVAKAANDSQGLPRLEINADTEQISGTTYGKQVSLPPTTLNLILRPTHGWPKAENLELRSVFANASASGEMQKGHAKFDLDLGRLAEFIKPLVDMPDLRLEGQAAGQLNWALEEGERWQLSGRANGSRLAFKLPGGGSLVEEMLEVAVSAGGIWRNDSLAELSAATVRLSDNGQQWKVDLRQPIQQPSAGSALPIVAAGNGQLSALRQLLGPWLPAEIGDAEGTFIANVQATLGANKLQLANSTVELQQAAVLYDNQLYRPETVTMVFDGEAILPETSLVMRSLKINSPAAAAEVRGQWLPDTPPKFEAAYRVDLRRLGEIIGVDSAPAGTLAVRPASAVGAMTPAPTTVWFHGDVAGTASVSGSAEKYNLQINADATNLTVLQLTPPEATAGQVLPPTSPPPQMLWHEKLMHFEGLVAMDPTFSQYVAENLKIKGDWFDSLIVGKATMGENSSTTAGLDGKLTIDTAMLAQRLEPLIGQHLVLSGTHTGPIQATYESDANNSRWNATAELGWQSGQLASLELALQRSH